MLLYTYTNTEYLIMSYKKNHTNFKGYNPKASVKNNMLQFNLAGANTEHVYVGGIINMVDLYEPDQIRYVSFGRDISTRYKNIDDLDTKRYDHLQMGIIAVGRGSATSFGNVEGLDPAKYTSQQMMEISYGRGDNTSNGLVDDLDPEMYDGLQMAAIHRL